MTNGPVPPPPPGWAAQPHDDGTRDAAHDDAPGESGQQQAPQNAPNAYDGAGWPGVQAVPPVPPAPPAPPSGKHHPDPPGRLNPWNEQPGWQQSGWQPGGPQQTGWQQPGQFSGYVSPPKPGIIPLRPLRLGEILDGAFQAARKNAKAMFGSAVLFQLGVALLMGLGILGFFKSGFDLNALAQNEVSEETAATFGLSLLGAVGLFGLLTAASVMVLQGALVIPVSRAILNQKTGLAQMWSMARKRVWPLIGLCLLYLAAMVAALVVAVLMIVLLVSWLGPAGGAALSVLLFLGLIGLYIWIATKLAIAPAALVLERIGVFTAIGRSWQLTRANWWRTFGIIALTSMIVGIISSVITTPVGFVITLIAGTAMSNPTPEQALALAVVSAVISTLISSLFTAVAYAFQSGVVALIYIDLRMRREGFDVVLMKEMENGGPTAGPTGGAPDPSGYRR